MKKILTIFILSFLLFSCSNEEVINEETVKQDFYIETKKISDF
jgi:uncharacterized protein YcfL